MKRSGWTRSVLAWMLAVVGIASTVAAAAPASAEQTAYRAYAPQHTAGPSCPTLPPFLLTTGPHPLMDDHAVESRLVKSIPRLICSAGRGSTITIKSAYVFADDSPIMATIRKALRYQRFQRNVRVNIFVGRSYYTDSRWSAFRRYFRFANVTWCRTSCLSRHPEATSHGKWLQVSRLRSRLGGGGVVLSTSANLSAQQLQRANQSGILIMRNLAINRAFRNQYSRYVACHRGYRSCDRVPGPGVWRGSHGTYVYFAPSSDDPVAATVRHLDCSSGGSIEVLSLGVSSRSTFLKVLRSQRAAGCTVRAVIYHADTAPALKTSVTSVGCLHAQHDKTVIIDVHGVREVLAGSLDYNYGAVHFNDNQVVRTARGNVFRAYRAEFARRRAESHSCH